MSSSIEALDPRFDPDWDNRMAAWPEATVFHSSGWAHTLADGFECRPFYLALRGPRRWLAVLPMMESMSWYRGNRAVALPFTDHCGALTSGPDHLEKLVNFALETARLRHWRSIEFRGPVHDAIQTCPADEYIGHQIDLQVSAEIQWQMLRPEVRRAIHKAQASSFEVESSSDTHALHDLYWLQTLTRRRHGLPPQPWKFFVALKRHLLDQDLGVIIMIRRNEQPVAAALFLRFGAHAVFKYGASDERALSDRPNDLAMWEGINWCRQHGVRVLSLGKTRKDHEGLRRFKSGWGGIETTIPYYRYNTMRGSFETGRDWVTGWHNRIFRGLPVPVLQWAGNLLYRQMA